MSTAKQQVPADYWACACVKRDRQGTMKAVKMHPPTAKRCRVCGCQRPPEKATSEQPRRDSC